MADKISAKITIMIMKMKLIINNDDDIIIIEDWDWSPSFSTCLLRPPPFPPGESLSLFQGYLLEIYTYAHTKNLLQEIGNIFNQYPQDYYFLYIERAAHLLRYLYFLRSYTMLVLAICKLWQASENGWWDILPEATSTMQ